MRMFFAILIGKVFLFVLKKLNRGSALPGAISKFLYPKLLSKLIKPKITIAVTSTNGKTSTTSIIANIIRKNNYTVGHNLSGSNIDNGVISTLIDNSDLFGNITVDALVLEIDERHTKNIFKYFKPDYLVINNITRDQAPRNGNVDVIIDCLKESITEDIHLVINSDDALLNSFLYNMKNKKTYFGISINSEFKNNFFESGDIYYCPVCNNKLVFDYMYYSNTGKYSCVTKDFYRIKPDFEVTEVNFFEKYFIINKKHKVLMQNDIFFHIYNTLAAFTVLSLCNVKNILSSINETEFNIVRFEELNLKNKIHILSCKNETPNSYDQSLIHINRNKEKKVVLFGFNRICSRYFYSDLGWLYDVNFELLNSSNVEKIIVIGKFKYDIVSRLILAGINIKKIITVDTIDESIDLLKNNKLNVYAALNFDIVRIFSEKFKEANK